MEKTQAKSGLPNSIRYFYGIGDMLSALATSVYSYYLTFYLSNVALLSLEKVALLTGVCSVYDMCTSWLYGALLNAGKPGKYGRYRTWLLAMWLMPFAQFLMYFRIGKSDAVAMGFFFFAQIFQRFVMNTTYTANLSMIKVAGKTQEDRIAMSSSRAVWNGCSRFIWSWIGVGFLAFLIEKAGEQNAYALLASSLSLLGIVGYMIHFRMFKGFEETAEEYQAKSIEEIRKEKISAKDLLMALVTNRPLIGLFIANIASTLYNSMITGTVVYYFTYIALNKSMQSKYTLVAAFATIGGSYIGRYAGKKFTGRNTLIFGYIAMAITLFVARMNYTNVWLVIALLGVGTFFYGAVNTNTSALYGDCAVFAEWKTHKDATGFVMGLQNTPIKISSMLKGVLLPLVLAASGYDATIAAENAPLAMKVGIANTMFIVPCAFLVLGIFAMVFLYNLPKSRIVEMQKEIDERKAAEEAAKAE